MGENNISGIILRCRHVAGLVNLLFVSLLATGFVWGLGAFFINFVLLSSQKGIKPFM